MRLVTLVVAVALATTLGTPTAIAEGPPGVSTGGGSHTVPFSGFLRRCDGSDSTYVSAAGRGRGWADVSAQSGTVVADVHLITAMPDTQYNIRLIEEPRSPSTTCYPGDPGVADGVIFTDDGGNGETVLQEGVAPGATGAMLMVNGPPDGNAKSLNGDFYTSDFIAPI
jgi:hypothetical protein